MTSSIGTKIGAGFGAAIVGWVLQLVHFNPLEAVQSAGTLSGIIFLNAGLPAVFSICIIVFMLFWNIDKDMAGLDV